MNDVQTAMLLLGVFLLMGCEGPSGLETTDVSDGDDTAAVSDVSDDGDTATDDADGEPDDASSPPDDDGLWRSALYPEDWAPGDTDEDADGGTGHLQSSGIHIDSSKRVTIEDVVLENAQNRGPGGNGYLFEIRSSNEVLTRDSIGRGGRHNFTQNWGFGTTGCVWLRVLSEEGRAYSSKDATFGPTAMSNFHHSLATANLIDSSELNDGWSAVNRQGYSSGAGHTSTENVFWNSTGDGEIRSLQYGWGYVIGTGDELTVDTDIQDELGGSDELGNLAA